MSDKLIQLTMGNNTRLGYIIEQTIKKNENTNNTEDIDTNNAEDIDTDNAEDIYKYYFKQLPPNDIGFITIDKNTEYYDKENFIIKDDDVLFSTKFYMEKYKNSFKLYVKPFDIKFYLSTFSLDIVQFEKDNKCGDTYKIINGNIVSVNSNNSKYVLNYKYRLNKNNEYHPHYLSLISEKCVKNYPQEYKPISIL